MASERRTLYLAFGFVLLLVAVLLLWPRVREELEPELETAWVAIRPEGSDEAVVGTVELAAGTPFHLYAVLEARARDGSRVFYTEAPALRLPDGPVPAEALRRWTRPQEIRVLWFTVEGTIPFLKLEAGDTLERFRMTEFLRPEWPQTWSVPGTLDPANDDRLVRSGARGDNPFGTQRFHVRIELYGRDSRLVPEERYRSWGAAEAREQGEDFPTVVASLPGAIGPASSLFGLTEIQPPPELEKRAENGLEAAESMLREIRELTRRHLAFSRLSALESVISGVGKSVDELVWRRISLDAGLPWTATGDTGPTGVAAGVATGDLLRVGDRMVILYRDGGRPGVLDREDLCFDYALGAAVRAVGDVFVGGGEVEVASLGG
jgi:hypothetical protein